MLSEGGPLTHAASSRKLSKNSMGSNKAGADGYDSASDVGKDADHLVTADVIQEVEGGSDKDGGHISAMQSAADLYKGLQMKKDHILRRLKKDTEGAIVLTGALEFLENPIVAFVRLAEGIIMPNALEVPLPMRFVFVVLTPKPCVDMDYHEVGRSFSTLMSNPRFHNVCYRFEERREILSSINEFLDESVVLPPGDWNSNNLLSVQEIQEMRKRKTMRKLEAEGALQEEADEDVEKEVKEGLRLAEEGKTPGKDDDDDKDKKKKKHPDPLVRTNYPFGGVINDWKKRFPL